jgi:hypothetical protein
VAQYDSERNTLAAQFAVERGEVAQLSGQRDALAAERDALAAERDALAAERNALAAERDVLSAERNNFALQLSVARSESDVVARRILEANEQIARAEATIVHIASRYVQKHDASKKVPFLSRWKARSKGLTPPSGNSMDIEVIRNSVFFDERYYLQTNPDVREKGLDAALHYLAFGALEGRDPGPFFSTSAYLARCPDVAEAGLNPLLHYEAHGRGENRGVLPYSVKSRGSPSDGG